MAYTITNGYATLTEYKAWIAVRGLSGGVGTDTSDDDVLSELIEVVSRFFDQETGCIFYKESADATRYYTPISTISAKIDDMASVTSVSVDYEGLRSYTALTVNVDYELLPYNASLTGKPYNELAIIPTLSSKYFPLVTKGLRVVGKAGYPSVPKDIHGAVMATVQSFNANRAGQTNAGKITVTSGGIVIRPEDVPTWALEVIKHYRNRT